MEDERDGKVLRCVARGMDINTALEGGPANQPPHTPPLSSWTPGVFCIGKPGGWPTQSRGDQRSSGGGESKRSGAQIFWASPLLLGHLWLWR